MAGINIVDQCGWYAHHTMLIKVQVLAHWVDTGERAGVRACVLARILAGYFSKRNFGLVVQVLRAINVNILVNMELLHAHKEVPFKGLNVNGASSDAVFTAVQPFGSTDLEANAASGLLETLLAGTIWLLAARGHPLGRVGTFGESSKSLLKLLKTWTRHATASGEGRGSHLATGQHEQKVWSSIPCHAPAILAGNRGQL